MVRSKGLGIAVKILLGKAAAREKIGTYSPPEGEPLQNKFVLQILCIIP
jgi:hypothetical protein